MQFSVWLRFSLLPPVETRNVHSVDILFSNTIMMVSTEELNREISIFFIKNESPSKEHEYLMLMCVYCIVYSGYLVWMNIVWITNISAEHFLTDWILHLISFLWLFHTPISPILCSYFHSYFSTFSCIFPGKHLRCICKEIYCWGSDSSGQHQEQHQYSIPKW